MFRFCFDLLFPFSYKPIQILYLIFLIAMSLKNSDKSFINELNLIGILIDQESRDNETKKIFGIPRKSCYPFLTKTARRYHTHKYVAPLERHFHTH